MHKLHRILGWLLLIPLVIWAVTGTVFLLKPGYEQAYDRLAPKLYALGDDIPFKPGRHWTEVKWVRSILGQHLLVSEGSTQRHLEPETLEPKPLPNAAELSALVEDAIAGNKARYGNIVSIQDTTVTTDTGIEITLDWASLSLKQKGPDTRLISSLYKLHYLQWFDSKPINKLFAILVLCCLVLLALLGLMLSRRASQQTKRYKHV